MPVTLNRYLRMHWAARKRDLESWKYHVLGAGRPPGVPGKIHIRIVVYRAVKQDPDNAVGSVKPLIDSMVRLGWLQNDTTEFLELEVREEIDRKNQRTLVEWRVINGEK